jgi:hypothetical protein
MTSMIEIEERQGGVVLRVRVSPGASRARIIGEHAGALKLAVSAPPERGKANKAVCDLLAGAIGVARSQVRVIAGETSKDKKVFIGGRSRQNVEARVKQLIAPSIRVE